MPTIGTITSNVFRVYDPHRFVAWMKKNVTFEGDMTFTAMGGNALLLQVETESPSAFPRKHRSHHPGTDDWDLDEFAGQLRLHLEEGEEFRLLACGQEHKRCCHAQHLKISATEVSFVDLYEGT